MEKLETLKNALSKFLLDSEQDFNEKEEINYEEYFRLENEIDNLKIDDFSSAENYLYFLKYWKQDVSLTERLLIKKSIEEDNNISERSFYVISNDLRNLIPKLK